MLLDRFALPVSLGRSLARFDKTHSRERFVAASRGDWMRFC